MKKILQKIRQAWKWTEIHILLPTAIWIKQKLTAWIQNVEDEQSNS